MKKKSVILNVQTPEEIPADGEIFVTGSFNQWSLPGKKVRAEQLAPNRYKVRLEDVSEGLLEFRFTRGGTWSTVSCEPSGRVQLPFQCQVSFNNQEFDVVIPAWRDSFPASTATAQLQVLDETFYFPRTKVFRRVWIYLPEDYYQSSSSYPVLYMHDGQQLFDEAHSTGRTGPVEWAVDKQISRSGFPAIVVGIESAGTSFQRSREYLLHPTAQFSRPQGKALLADVVYALKPVVDRLFRTRTEKKYTAMAGSSLGGLLSLYAGLHFPAVFGHLGVFSPSIWIDHGRLYNTLEEIAHRNATELYKKQRYYFYAGGEEKRPTSKGQPVRMISNMNAFSSALAEVLPVELEVSCRPSARHGAWYWQQEFLRFYDWWREGMKR